ncbi:Probable receptor-like protein kinase [Striga hermonthica]|uniref:Probable receptor-like protein kinase n=1 Tax=Striga hermonthica TaxID=68872 RepID=A0A9N7NVJ2_STRHE|nr:Probable receptor-like protein kinase [Striga hermonthica]
MKCFQLFGKQKLKGGDSAPELSGRSRRISSDEGTSNRAAQSAAGSSCSPRRTIPEIYRAREHGLRVFSLSELREATNNFNRLLKIGEGGFGTVYKGSLKPAPPNRPNIVAIKKLNARGLQGHKQWVAEVQFLGVLDHPNLVKLLGYCSLDGERGIQRLLVYEYMPNKSLEDHLFNQAVPTIPWLTRINIILGSAQGMAYLHEGSEVQDFNAKLSDFGLAREGPIGDRTHVSTAPIGTRGYAAPEYVETGHLSVKSDIWSFGVVLYEILTGRRTLERHLPLSERKLLEWVKLFPADSKRFSTIIDPRLHNQYSLTAARRIAKLADMCLNRNPKDRPTMTQVMEILKQAMEDSKEFSRSSSLTTNYSNEILAASRHLPQMAQA